MTIQYNFDAAVHRRGTDAAKWGHYDPDVLPLWVADMDFRAPEPVIQALHNRVQHGVFGYASQRPERLIGALQERLLVRHGLRVDPEAITLTSGIVSAFNAAIRAVTTPGDGVLLSTPVYAPFLAAVDDAGCTTDNAILTAERHGSRLRYEIDFDALEAAITPRTRLLMLCNPHNPVGRVYTRGELERIAEICLRHDLIICADEIHCDLLLDDIPHTSIAALGPEVAERTITLIAPSKTFNLPGLGCGVSVVTNADLRERLNRVSQGIVAHVNVLGLVAAEAAYLEGQPWLDALLPRLRENRDAVVDFVETQLPDVATTVPEGTYLAWLDCRALPLPDGDSPYTFFLEKGRVALNDGPWFGRGGEGFVRLNFACSPGTLAEGLGRMKAAIDGLG